MDIPKYQQRVMIEKTELDAKIEKLEKFQQGEQFHVLCDERERVRMIDQLNYMTLYSEVLGKRIAAF